MKLADIQSTAKSLLEAHPGLLGVPVLADDGSYPQTPDREAALKTEGVVIILWQINTGELKDTTRPGRFAQTVEMPISVEENQAVNLGGDGLGIKAETIVQEILTALSGKPSIDDPFMPANPPFANFGKVDGVNQWIINITAQNRI